MSAVGALIEAGVVPSRGSLVRLARGSLSIAAEVAWAAEGRCGLRFVSTVFVRDWLAPPANREQQRVDDVVRLVKAGAVPLVVHHSGGAAQCTPATSMLALAEDLRRAARLVEAVGDHLASDKETVARHGDKLQNLDVVLQTISSVANTLGEGIGEGRDEAGLISALPTERRSI